MFLRLGTWTVPSLSRRDVAGTGDVGERKNQLICTTRLTHYTIAAARDLVWGGDFLGDDDGRRGASGSVWFGKFRTTRHDRPLFYRISGRKHIHFSLQNPSAMWHPPCWATCAVGARFPQGGVVAWRGYIFATVSEGGAIAGGSF